MSGLSRVVNRVKSLFADIMHYIVGKAARNRDTFLETVEEGEEVVGATEDSWEGVVFVLTLAITVLLQFVILNIHFIFVTGWLTPLLLRSILFTGVVIFQVRLITGHLRRNHITVEG